MAVFRTIHILATASDRRKCPIFTVFFLFSKAFFFLVHRSCLVPTLFNYFPLRNNFYIKKISFFYFLNWGKSRVFSIKGFVFVCGSDLWVEQRSFSFSLFHLFPKKVYLIDISYLYSFVQKFRIFCLFTIFLSTKPLN